MFSKRAPFVPESLHKLGFAGKVLRGQPVIIPPVVRVSAGPFLMGSGPDDPQAFNEEKPQHTVTLPAYRIGKYPLTVAEYICAIRAGVVAEPEPSDVIGGMMLGREPITWEVQLRHPDNPVVSIPLGDCARYARWLSGLTGEYWRLPTEAEWEKAARGTDGRIYPWGNHWDPTRANTETRTPEEREKDVEETMNALDRSPSTLEEFLRLNARRLKVNGITPVGTYPRGASPYGATDMVGNTLEITASVWGPPYPYRPDDGRDDVTAFKEHVLRGGAWYLPPRIARCACRYVIRMPMDHFGTRLALDG